MSLVDEVEGLIAYATAYVANLDPAFKPRYPEGDLAKHGPAILAGLRLAEELVVGIHKWPTDGLCMYSDEPAVRSYWEASKAYRTATGANDAE